MQTATPYQSGVVNSTYVPAGPAQRTHAPVQLSFCTWTAMNISIGPSESGRHDLRPAHEHMLITI